MEIFSGILGIVLIILLVILTVLWIALPFAIFGIKERLDKILENLHGLNQAATLVQHEVRKTNQILKAVHNVEE